MTEGNDETPKTNNMSIPIGSATIDGISGTTTNHRIPTTNKENGTIGERITTEIETASRNGKLVKYSKEVEDFVPLIRWPDTIVQLFLHLGCAYGLFLCIVYARFYTTLFGE